MCEHEQRFSIEHYISLICEKKTKEALDYKNKKVPNKLYKYMWLDSMPICEAIDKEICPCLRLNEIKISNLRNNELWLCSREYLNDPFEFNALYLDKELLQQKGYSIDSASKMLDMLKNWNVGSFTTNLEQSMPMWAHYTNNHQGFCVEYVIEKPNYVFPVMYEPKRIKIARLIAEHLRAAYIFSKGDKLSPELQEELEYNSLILFHSSLVKHISWSYEKEYRICMPKDLQLDMKKGYTYPNKLLGIKPSCIYLGINCEQEYRDKLKEVAEELGIKIMEMYFCEDVEEFTLMYREL